MHPQLQQHLLNIGLDFDTAPPNKETWQAFLRLLNTEFFSRHDANGKTKPILATPMLEEVQQFDQRIIAERDKLKAVLAALDKGVCVFDIQGRLILLNAAAKRYLGSVQPLTGENVLRYFKVHDQWSADMMGAPLLLQLIREGSNLRDTDAALIRDDGSELPVSFVLNPLINKRHVIGSVLVFEDICEHKQVEAALLAAKNAAEKASTAKSEFMTSMSHELRTPMNAILGYGDIILDELSEAPEACDPEMIEELQLSIQNILQAGRTLLGLINGVLDLSRLESGKLDIHVEKVDLGKLVEERLQLQMDVITQQNINVEICSAPPISVLADVHHLAQIIDNLLSNAVKYNRPGGSIQLSLDIPTPTRVRLYIKDTGVGITQEQQTQIFQPFVRVSGRNLTVGTGIGLTVCKHLVEIMGGHIGLESVIGEGSTFWVEFPLEETNEEDSLETLGLHRRFLMLYIEDSRTNVSLVTKIIKSRPEIALVSAPNGEMGVELARSHNPDLVLLDINLPGIDGFEVLRRIHALEATRKVPVIGLSADDTQNALRQAEDAGFYRYMIKPLNKEQFLDAVDTILHIQGK